MKIHNVKKHEDGDPYHLQVRDPYSWQTLSFNSDDSSLPSLIGTRYGLEDSRHSEPVS